MRDVNKVRLALLGALLGARTAVGGGVWARKLTKQLEQADHEQSTDCDKRQLTNLRLRAWVIAFIGFIGAVGCFYFFLRTIGLKRILKVIGLEPTRREPLKALPPPHEPTNVNIYTQADKSEELLRKMQDLRDAEERHNATRETLAKCKGELSGARDELQETKSALADSNKRCERHKNKVRKLNIKLRTNEELLKIKDNTIKFLEGHITSLEKSLNNLTDALKAQGLNINNLTDALKAQGLNINKLTTQLKDLRNVCETISKTTDYWVIVENNTPSPLMIKVDNPGLFWSGPPTDMTLAPGRIREVLASKAVFGFSGVKFSLNGVQLSQLHGKYLHASDALPALTV